MKSLSRVLLLVVISLMLVGCYGRSPSRYFGKDHRQVLNIPMSGEVISISFDHRDGSTVKDVTFRDNSGRIFTKEFKDVSPLEGTIEWVPYGQGSDVVQSRTLSRWFGDIVRLELPEDCMRIINVDVTYASDDERTKNVAYLSTSGRILAKEYREGIFDRNFEGWLEVTVGQ